MSVCVEGESTHAHMKPYGWPEQLLQGEGLPGSVSGLPHRQGHALPPPARGHIPIPAWTAAAPSERPVHLLRLRPLPPTPTAARQPGPCQVVNGTESPEVVDKRRDLAHGKATLLWPQPPLVHLNSAVTPVSVSPNSPSSLERHVPSHLPEDSGTPMG